MRVLSLEVQDILSIQKASLKFEDTGLVLVKGWNHDTQRANGAGKTALFNSLSFALYDKLPRKITASEILRRGCKTGFAEASVLCGDDVWTVRRSRPKNAVYSKNGIVQDIVQSEFESYIRLNYDQFLLTIYTPQANSREPSRFLSAPDTDKKEFLLQLLNLDQFGAAKKALDGLIVKEQAGIDVEERKIQQSRSKVSAYEESLVDTASLHKQINELQSSLVTIENAILEQSNVAKPDLSKYLPTEDGIRTKQAEIAQAKAKRGMLHDRYRELRAAIHEYNSDAACNECGSSLDTPEARTAHSESQEKTKAKAVSIKEQIDAVDLIISKEQAVTDLSKKLRDKKAQESSDYQAAQLRVADLKATLRNKQLVIENSNLKLSTNSDLLNKIQLLEVTLDNSIAIQATIKKQLEIYKTLSSVYSPTGAQAYVLDSVVDSFNEIIQKYIDIMSPNMSYVLNSFKENAKGDVVAKFSETLMKSGTDVSVGSLSGGEEKGLSLCVDFALLEVLETQFGMSLNPIILDEPFDGLDAAGREVVVDLLENLARTRQIFVVDHASESQAMFSKSIKVELKNEVSTISLDY